MAEFIDIKEKTVDVGDLVFFENKTDSDYEVSAGIIFKKSGVYEVTIVGNKTFVTKVTERKHGHWIEAGREEGALGIEYKRLRCPKCGWESSLPIPRNFCPECGSDMREGEQDAVD